MKTQLTFLLILLFSAFAGAQIPGGNFETWGAMNFESPHEVGWNTYKDDITPETLGLIEKSTDANDGNYSLKLKTGSNQHFGYIFYGELVGDGIDLNGVAVPFSDNPTQLSLSYKCNMAIGDSAYIWVIFVYEGDNGLEIVHDQFKVGGNQSVFNDTTFNFSAYPTPIKIIFGLFPCDPGEENWTAGNEVYFDNVRLLNGAKNSQLPNNSFEDWISNSREFTSEMHNAKALIEKSNEAYKGNFALKMSTQKAWWDEKNQDIDFDSQLELWGKTETVEIAQDNYEIHINGGIPVPERNDSLIFYYKYIPSAGVTDTASATLRFQKSGVEVINYNYLLLPTSTYTKFAIPYDLDNNWTGTSVDADSMVLVFESSKWRNNWSPTDVNINGSSLYIDYMYFKSQMCEQLTNVGVNGTVSPIDTLLLKGSNITYTITPNNGFIINTVFYNGIDVYTELVKSGNSYTYTAYNVTEYGKLVVDFKVNTDVDDISNSNDIFVIYPNPSSGKLYLQGPDKDYLVELVSVSGNVMIQKKVKGNSFIDISNLAKGLYLLKIDDRLKSKIIKR